MKAHSELSASGSERWIKCAGSVALSRNAPVLPDSSAASEGTLAHEYLEKWIRKILKFKESNWESLAPKGLKENDNMYQSVRLGVEYVEKSRNKNTEILIEQIVSLEHIHPKMFGTADIVIIEPYGHLQVWDYKHGKGHRVSLFEENENGDKELNTQLVYYALGVANLYDYEFDSVTLGVIQPRASATNKIRSVTTTMTELIKYEKYFRDAAARTEIKKPELFKGNWCYFCPAKDYNCRLHRDIKGAVKNYFND